MTLATVDNVESNDFSFSISKCVCSVKYKLFLPPSLPPSLPLSLSLFSPDTYHVVSATIVSSNETTICLECSFRHNSPSTGCYAVFHPINHTGKGVSYHKIMKSLADTTASDCINTLPNGVYSVSVLDVLSYEEERYNNFAVTIPLLITVNTSNTSILNQTTIILNGILCLCICVYVYVD